MGRFFISFIFVFLLQNAFGQISFSTEVARDSMQLGDHNTYKVKIAHAPDVIIQSINLMPLQTTMMDALIDTDTALANNSDMQDRMKEEFTKLGFADEVMEVINWGNWNAPNESLQLTNLGNWKSETIDDQVLKTNEIKFTFWQEGQHTILTPIVTYQKSGAAYTTTAPEVMVMVGSPLVATQSEVDTAQAQLDPIKNIIDEPLNIWQDILWPYGKILLLLFMLGDFLYFLYKKSQEEEAPKPEPVVIVPAHETAFGKLGVLEKEELWQKGNIKEYQSQLTYIIREYLENRYDINALENTTGQIKRDLKKLNLDDTLQNELQNILQVADLVKFAKAKPGANVHQEFMKKAKNFVSKTKKEIIIHSEGSN